jgi:hypothetical protein
VTLRTVLSGIVLVTVASACDPGVLMYARQPLQPADPEPSLSCIASALAESPGVIEVTRLERGYGREGLRVVVRDSTAKRGRREALVLRPVPPDSGVVIMAFTWVGRLRRPAIEEERAVAAIARRALAEVRTACAPASPTQVECAYSDGHHVPACGSEG